MDRAESAVFFGLLRQVICGTELGESERNELSPRLAYALMELAARHDLAHLAAAAIQKTAPEISQDVAQAVYTAVYRSEQMEYELQRLCGILEGVHLPFVPLKGAVVRQLYPERWMRTSCDIDLLVKEQDTDRAIAALLQQGYERTEDNSTHDYCLRSPSGVHIELHYTLRQDGELNGADPVLDTVWDCCRSVDGWEYRLQMSGEMMVFYHLAHMAKHLLHGGCGVRPFVDLWLMESKLPVDKGALEQMLAAAGLGDFYRAALDMSRVWLESAPYTDVTCGLEEYVLSGGAYGTSLNAAKTQAAGGGGRLRAFMEMVFLPRENLQVIYPALKNRPCLAPVYQLRRWLRVFDKNKRKKISDLNRARAGVTDAQAQKTAELFDGLGLPLDKK